MLSLYSAAPYYTYSKNCCNHSRRGVGGRYLVSGALLLADCVMPCADLLLLRKSPLADLHAVQRRERTE